MSKIKVKCLTLDQIKRICRHYKQCKGCPIDPHTDRHCIIATKHPESLMEQTIEVDDSILEGHM